MIFQSLIYDLLDPSDIKFCLYTNLLKNIIISCNVNSIQVFQKSFFIIKRVSIVDELVEYDCQTEDISFLGVSGVEIGLFGMEVDFRGHGVRGAAADTLDL
jgi:hypothetical protein